jgi:hypothetical protein
VAGADEATIVDQRRAADGTLGVATEVVTVEGAEACVATASGMSAIMATVMSLTRAGDHVVAAYELFGATLQMFTILQRFGVEVTYVPIEDTDAWRIFHGVTEGRPGLSIDRYGPLLLAQIWFDPPSAAERACSSRKPSRCRPPNGKPSGRPTRPSARTSAARSTRGRALPRSRQSLRPRRLQQRPMRATRATRARRTWCR